MKFDSINSSPQIKVHKFRTINKTKLEDSGNDLLDYDSLNESKTEIPEIKNTRFAHGTVLASLKAPPFQEGMIDPINLEADVTNNSKLPISTKDAKLIHHQ